MDKNTTNNRSMQFYGEDFWNCARNISHSKARRLVGNFGFTVHDVPDIEQELLLALIKRLSHYDPEKSRETTFIMRVVESKIVDLINYRQAGCRDWRRQGFSLNTSASQTDIETSDLVSETNEDIYLMLDIAELIRKLPPELAELCQMLKDYSVAEILDDCSISRTVFYRKLQKIKKIFQQSFSNGKFP